MSTATGILTGAGLRVEEGEAAIERLVELLGEPAWRREQRLEAWRTYTQTRMPDPRSDEDWRRTSLRGLNLVTRPVALEGGLEFDGLEQAPNTGVVCVPIERATVEHEALWRAHAFSALAPTHSKFVALSEALCQTGALIYVPDGLELSAPIVVRHEINGPANGFGAFRHTLVVLGANAKAQIVVLDRSAAEPEGVAFSALEVVLGDGARLEYTSVQTHGAGVMRFETRRAMVGRDAEISWIDCELGGRLSRVEIESHLGNPGAGVRSSALVFGDAQQHLDLLNRAHHIAAHTRSELRGRVALNNRARSVYRGIVIMDNGCAGANSQQSCDSVLLSPDARSDAIPSLFIDEDDVRAGHGATAGPLDEDQIFYMMARGIERTTCERLILQGFFAPVLEHVEGTPAEPLLLEAMEHKLGTLA